MFVTAFQRTMIILVAGALQAKYRVRRQELVEVATPAVMTTRYRRIRRSFPEIGANKTAVSVKADVGCILLHPAVLHYIVPLRINLLLRLSGLYAGR